MVKMITVSDLREIVKTLGMKNFFIELIEALQKDFSRWQQFEKSPRHAIHLRQGVIELMPISDSAHYAFKYVNGHPENPARKKLTVVAFGALAAIDNGYPQMISEMTLLTAFRTAATNVLAAKYLARKNASTLAIIGTGAQAEFLTLAHYFFLGIDRVRFFDIDAAAMKKFSQNLSEYPLELIACEDAFSAVSGADIIVTATADKKRAQILKNDWITAGVHINGVGGDCPGKTELDPSLLSRSKIVVEFFEQTRLEGETQNLLANTVYAELWEIISGKKPGRVLEEEITLFDSTGFALEDYSVLKWLYEKSEQLQIGHHVDLIPQLVDPKNLFGCLR